MPFFKKSNKKPVTKNHQTISSTSFSPNINGSSPENQCDSQSLLPTEEVITLSKKGGAEFGHGNPIERIRYFIKLGILPHAVRKLSTTNNHQPLTPIGHLPFWTVQRLIETTSFNQKGFTFPQIAKRYKKQEIASIREKSAAEQISPIASLQRAGSHTAHSPFVVKVSTINQVNQSQLDKKLKEHEKKIGSLVENKFKEQYAMPVFFKDTANENRPKLTKIRQIAYATVIFSLVSGFIFIGFQGYKRTLGTNSSQTNQIATDFREAGQVLAASSEKHKLYIDANTEVSGTTIFAENITAPNVVYGVTGGTGIAVTSGQNPVVSLDSASIVTSINDTSGTITLKGSGSTTVSESAGTITISSSSSGLTSEADTLSTVTGRGATTATATSFTGGATVGTSLTLSPFSSAGGVLYTNGAGVVAQATAGTSSQCLLGGSTPTFGSCASGGVASLDGLTGVLTISNTSGSGTTITIDDATTAAKGIASFSSGNFSVTSGAVSIKTGGVTSTEILDGTIAGGDLASNITISTTGTIATTGSGTITSAGTLTASGDLTVNGNTTLGNAATDTITLTGEIQGASPLTFEGLTADNIYTIFAITDPTVSAKTITFPNATGTVAVSATAPITLSSAGDIGCVTCLTSTGGGTFAITLAGTSGSNQTINAGDTITIAAGTDITTTGGATDTVTIANTSTLATVTGRGATTPTLVNLDGGIAVDTSNFTVSGTTGAIVTASDLTVNGNTTLGDTNTADTLTSNLLTSAITSGATTQNALLITASSLTTGTALTLTGPTSTGVITGTSSGFVKITSDVGSAGTGGSLLYLAPDFSAGSATTSYGILNKATDASDTPNTNYANFNSLTLTNNAAKVGYASYGITTSSSVTSDTTYGGYFSDAQTGANTTGTKALYGVYGVATATNGNAGNSNVYGGLFSAVGDPSGTGNAYGIFVSASTGDTNYGLYVGGGNTYVGTTVYGASLSACNTTTEKLLWTAAGTFTCGTDAGGSGALTGSGTGGTIARWTGVGASTALGDSSITDTGTAATATGTFTANGAATFNTDVDFTFAGTENIALTSAPAANAGVTTDSVQLTLTTPVHSGAGTNVHNLLDLDATIGNASAGTNTANVINIGAITGDAEVTLNALKIGNLTATGATEYALNIGTGWDDVLNVGGTT
ncbi:MAG: hypothetical protein AAB512_03690, partial [Patescibacteria group bacterium]